MADTGTGPVLRLFDVKVKPGRAADLLANFATTSVDVVRGKPGNQGCFFGQDYTQDGDRVVFASLWADLDAVKARFGDDWQVSFLPPGYEDLIDECSIRHINLAGGWHIQPTE